MAERPDVCGSCNKRLNRKHWYYRHGGDFCDKACWRTAVQKTKTEQAEKAEKANAEQAKKEQAKAEPVAAEAEKPAT